MSVTRTGATPMGSIEREAAAQVNNLVADVEALRAKIDEIITAAATNIAAVAAVTPVEAVDLTATTINDAAGEVA